jgi:ComF family protein
LRERGFNQADLLGRPLAEAHGWQFDASPLIRVRETRRQTELPAGDRLRNVAGAFGLADASAVAGKRVLLVDDVCTTGATLAACAQPLMAAGAEGVWGIVVARDIRGQKRSDSA